MFAGNLVAVFLIHSVKDLPAAVLRVDFGINHAFIVAAVADDKVESSRDTVLFWMGETRYRDASDGRTLYRYGKRVVDIAEIVHKVCLVTGIDQSQIDVPIFLLLVVVGLVDDIPQGIKVRPWDATVIDVVDFLALPPGIHLCNTGRFAAHPPHR